MRELTTLPTPSLLIDGARVERNVTRMATRIAALGARLRPHVKTHKAIEVGRMQVKAGMRGITVSTLAEARAFAAHGFDDITYGVPVEPGKYAAVTAMNAAGTRLAVLTDDGDVPASLAAAARAAGTTVDVYLKVDCGPISASRGSSRMRGTRIRREGARRSWRTRAPSVR